MLDKVRIVLVGTTHSGNIGSVARAMKTMGLSQLVLVDPQCEIDGQAMALAAGASDLLRDALIVPTLTDAIADCALVAGTSARSRSLPWPMLSPRELGEKAAVEGQQAGVALVFGRERSGLSNDELQQCHFHVCIDANPEYSSLNLAQAVQILCYEVRMASLAAKPAVAEEESVVYPPAKAMENFYEHLEQSLDHSGFLIKAHQGKVMEKLRCLFNRARPDEHELNILRGILSSILRLKRD
ncbi:tRNA (cytosine(32)/uridine(32)-2'-O)-methyltransferase TrmJ [Gallaecimonas kandeliae]|uniref:tRNA (cytosine(32)/uridine(32)-2'-O)-methyltransferase TrmJ n=1 Tax=Gallaecimonas kandeliae TaxID=3029055 RepID=UPI002648FB32|nr:tRNA (cytosine(32)/uridine(32)-2'-O)-methyltransferase TrmJ [Gallaecimonas kandeliae]WKE64673.1 tRNA (cytosine(32)/uridine(32)-2'-O)-methyltransferase TrmJ [Gallaecimonas kandeliae]